MTDSPDDLSTAERDLLRRAVDGGGRLDLDDGAAVDGAVLRLLAMGLIYTVGAVGDDRLVYGLTPDGRRVAGT
jgi:hypothetical protein